MSGYHLKLRVKYTYVDGDGKSHFIPDDSESREKMQRHGLKNIIITKLRVRSDEFLGLPCTIRVRLIRYDFTAEGRHLQGVRAIVIGIEA